MGGGYPSGDVTVTVNVRIRILIHVPALYHTCFSSMSRTHLCCSGGKTHGRGGYFRNSGRVADEIWERALRRTIAKDMVPAIEDVCIIDDGRNRIVGLSPFV